MSIQFWLPSRSQLKPTPTGVPSSVTREPGAGTRAIRALAALPRHRLYLPVERSEPQTEYRDAAFAASRLRLSFARSRNGFAHHPAAHASRISVHRVAVPAHRHLEGLLDPKPAGFVAGSTAAFTLRGSCLTAILTRSVNGTPPPSASRVQLADRRADPRGIETLIAHLLPQATASFVACPDVVVLTLEARLEQIAA